MNKQPHILVVDDEKRMADSLKDLLSGLEYNVDAVYDGKSAEDNIKSNNYDLILTDIKLPYKTGHDLLKLSKDHDPEAVVILMTGYASLESAVDAISEGAYDYLLKPVEFSHLQLAVKRGLDKRFSNLSRIQLLEELEEKNKTLNRRIAELNALYKAGMSLSTTIEIKELLVQIIELATKVIGAKTGSVMLLDKNNNCLRISAAIGIKEDIIKKVVLPLGESIAGLVAQTGKPVMIEDIETDKEFKRKAKSQYETKSLISVPLQVKGEIIGVINITNRIGRDKFTEEDLKLLTTLASQAAIAIDDAVHFEEASRKLKEFVALYEIASELPNMDDFPQMARLVHFHMKNIMPVELTLWLSYDTRARRLTFNFWEGWGKELFRRIENSEILLQPNQIDHSKERANVVLDFLNKNLPIEGKIKSFRAVPIYTKGNFYGLFCMGSLQEDSFNVDNEYLASIVTSQTTSLYERQQAMLNASQLLTMGNMISEISHDLRKPLTNVKGGLQVLRERWPEINEKDDFFVMAEQELSRLSELVRELVDFSNPKKYQTERKRVEDAIERAIKLVNVDLERKSIELRTNIEENLPLVPINSNQIIEVFLNMFMNAIDAMKEKGKLTVSVRRYDNPKTEKKEVRIEISDTGKGIAPENLEKVFDRYFTTKETGTGLGLAIVERIIKAHNGNIEVKSKLNEGSNFIISLPVS